MIITDRKFHQRTEIYKNDKMEILELKNTIAIIKNSVYEFISSLNTEEGKL